MNYCIWCHTQGEGFLQQGPEGPQNRRVPEIAHSACTLAGCPLDEKISEMHKLRAEGCVLGAFAAIAVDNPMMAATGHRICNDCMKACIYQKQEPVDIPQAETSILKDVLALPWGFEIYALLTRWNPLDIRRPLPRPDSGRKVLIVGLGPAGFTLAHHLMNDGHTVVAIDGLKIEPLGFDPDAADPRHRTLYRKPRRSRDGRLRRRRRIRHHRALEQELPEARPPAAGAPRRNSPISAACVSAAARRSTWTTPGRWASTTSRSAWAPASRRCSTSRTGSRAACAQASDFLMALQLTGAAKILLDRQPAASPAGGGDRRRPDRDRHRDRKPRLLRPPGGEIRPALPHAGRRTWRKRGPRRAGPKRKPQSPTNSWPTPRRSAPSAPPLHAKAARPQLAAAARFLGRRDHRLSPPADRLALLHAQPRGGGQGDGRRRCASPRG